MLSPTSPSISLPTGSRSVPAQSSLSPSVPPSLRFSASSAGEAPKQALGNDAFNIYMRDMRRNADRKTQFFVSALDGLRTEGPTTLVDIGSCTGDLVRNLARLFPGAQTVGLELNENMIEQARRLDEEALQEHPVSLKRPRYESADATELDMPANSVDAFTLSSVFHELYSYNDPAYSREALTNVFKGLHDILKPGGRIVIRDPGRPQMPDELLTLETLPQPDKKSPTTPKELLATHPAELSQDALLKRFLHQFKPAEGQWEDLGDQKYRMPAWLVSEFLRHRRLTDTPEHWDSEMQEQYGVFNEVELNDFAKQTGLKSVWVQTSFEEGNHAAGYEGELKITDAKGREIDQPTRLPTHMFAVLEKPRTDGLTTPKFGQRLSLTA